jgi:beta-glucosidase-like glycosyl hydrolase
MNLTPEQLIKDLELDNLSKDSQEAIIGSFSRALQAKVQIGLLDRLNSEQQEEFSNLDESAQDDYLEKAVGGDMDAYVDELYKESVEEFLKGSQSIVDGLSGK